jgi:hypothetical protein
MDRSALIHGLMKIMNLPWLLIAQPLSAMKAHTIRERTADSRKKKK